MILVTGHKGFIGSHLTKALDRLSIKWWGFDLADGQDIRDKLALEKVFDSNPVSIVIHLAALTGARRGENYPQEYFDTNVIGTENIVKLCEKHGIKRLLAFSSSSAKTCQNVYGITKYTMELMLKRYSIPYLYVIRPFNVYGENGRPDQVIWKWLERAKAGLPIEYHGDFRRNYTYVGDIIDGILSCLICDGVNHRAGLSPGVYDFGKSGAVPLSELLTIFKEKFPNLVVIPKEMQDVATVPESGLDFPTDFITKVKELIK